MKYGRRSRTRALVRESRHAISRSQEMARALAVERGRQEIHQQRFL